MEMIWRLYAAPIHYGAKYKSEAELVTSDSVTGKSGYAWPVTFTLSEIQSHDIQPTQGVLKKLSKCLSSNKEWTWLEPSVGVVQVEGAKWDPAFLLAMKDSEATQLAVMCDLPTFEGSPMEQLQAAVQKLQDLTEERAKIEKIIEEQCQHILDRHVEILHTQKYVRDFISKVAKKIHVPDL